MKFIFSKDDIFSSHISKKKEKKVAIYDVSNVLSSYSYDDITRYYPFTRFVILFDVNFFLMQIR